MIIAYVSELNRRGFHDLAPVVTPVSPATEEAASGQFPADIIVDGARVDEKVKPILRYVKKLTLTPGQLTQQDAQRIFDAGWDERAFLESVCICAIANCLNRFMTGTGIDTDEVLKVKQNSHRVTH